MPGQQDGIFRSRRCVKMASIFSRVSSGFEPAQHVVGADFDDGAVGSLAQSPVEPLPRPPDVSPETPALSMVDVIALFAQGFLQNRRKGGVGGQGHSRR